MHNDYIVTYYFGTFNWKTFVYDTVDKYTLIVPAHNEEEAKKVFMVHAEHRHGKKKNIVILRIDPYIPQP